MEWKTVDDYLTDIARLIHEPRETVRLFRDGPGAMEITEANVDHGYLKPDQGFGARLNSYFVQLISPHKGDRITSWGLYEFPSCCAFCVSTMASVHKLSQNKGVNSRSNLFRQALARDAGYTALICTDVKTNYAERRTLEKNGFKDIYEIRNKRTGNTVAISVKEL